MGELKVTKLSDYKDRANYLFHLLRDIEALDLMIEKDLIEKTPIRIGAEQEFCLVTDDFNPSPNAMEVLESINDDHFTTEIGNFNLELNLDPFELRDDCFTKLNNQLTDLMEKAKAAAAKHKTKIVLTGILPTLTLKHIGVENMAPIKRYSVLNDALTASRNQEFEIHIKGVDELNLLHDSVMLEGCNTSFQVHLQINPDDFIQSYNWAQAISGPVLSVCTNSPLLFGKELWSETRIALFTQSVDTRTNSFTLNEKQARVSFGSNWATGSVSSIFKDNVARFRSLLTSDFERDSVEMVNSGEIPKLKALNLHSGTVYLWNRACYGVGNGKPHLRIENRYIPSGPTLPDEIANTMFWIGLMVGRPKEYNHISKKMDFKDAKANFFNAARYGMSSQFVWNNKFVPSHTLILDELLPIAYRGLYSLGVSPKDVEYYLKIIENRVKSHTGSQWIKASYRNLLENNKPFEASQILTSKLYDKQEKNYPVSSWKILKLDSTPSVKIPIKVKHKMSTDIFSVSPSDSLELVARIMEWKNIRHMPVIDTEKELVGLLSQTDINTYLQNNNSLSEAVKNVMVSNPITIDQYAHINTAEEVMNDNDIHCVPVVHKKKLVGMLTSKDL